MEKILFNLKLGLKMGIWSKKEEDDIDDSNKKEENML